MSNIWNVNISSNNRLVDSLKTWDEAKIILSQNSSQLFFKLSFLTLMLTMTKEKDREVEKVWVFVVVVLVLVVVCLENNYYVSCALNNQLWECVCLSQGYTSKLSLFLSFSPSLLHTHAHARTTVCTSCSLSCKLENRESRVCGVCVCVCVYVVCVCTSCVCVCVSFVG